MISVVIPAWNEQAVLPRVLSALTTGARDGELEVIVACNGCTDRTREIAASWGAPVRAIEIPVASKSAALRAGDAAAGGFPRFYVDADVELPLASLRAVARVLEAGPALVASPRLEVESSMSSWAVRAYYAVWTQLPYHRDGVIGSGVYAVSEAGRRSFDTFPDLISDDGWIRLQFAPGARRSVAGSAFRIVAPRTLGALIRVKIRRQRGKTQLRRALPTPTGDGRRRSAAALAAILLQPRLWGAVPVYVAVLAVTTALAHRRDDPALWERDETSRDGEPHPP